MSLLLLDGAPIVLVADPTAKGATDGMREKAKEDACADDEGGAKATTAGPASKEPHDACTIAIIVMANDTEAGWRMLPT